MNQLVSILNEYLEDNADVIDVYLEFTLPSMSPYLFPPKKRKKSPYLLINNILMN